MTQYRTIRLPEEMVKEIGKIRNKKPQLGFTSNAEFIKHSTRELMLRINGDKNE